MENSNYKNKIDYDWLINYNLEAMKNVFGGFKDKVVSLFDTKTPKQTEYGRGKKLSKPKIH